MILGNDTADETDESLAGCNRVLVYVDQANPVVELIHMFGTLIKINDRSGSCLDTAVCHIQQMFCFSFAFSACNDLNHSRVLLGFIESV